MKKRSLFTCFSLLTLFILTSFVHAQEARGLWVRIWDMNTEAKIQAVVNKARQYNYNQLYVHIRYRADAYYYPNRLDSTFPNSEPRSQAYSVTPSEWMHSRKSLIMLIPGRTAGSSRLAGHFNAWRQLNGSSLIFHVYISILNGFQRQLRTT